MTRLKLINEIVLLALNLSLVLETWIRILGTSATY